MTMTTLILVWQMRQRKDYLKFSSQRQLTLPHKGPSLSLLAWPVPASYKQKCLNCHETVESLSPLHCTLSWRCIATRFKSLGIKIAYRSFKIQSYIACNHDTKARPSQDLFTGKSSEVLRRLRMIIQKLIVHFMHTRKDLDCPEFASELIDLD